MNDPHHNHQRFHSYGYVYWRVYQFSLMLVKLQSPGGARGRPQQLFEDSTLGNLRLQALPDELQWHTLYGDPDHFRTHKGTSDKDHLGTHMIPKRIKLEHTHTHKLL